MDSRDVYFGTVLDPTGIGFTLQVQIMVDLWIGLSLKGIWIGIYLVNPIRNGVDSDPIAEEKTLVFITIILKDT